MSIDTKPINRARSSGPRPHFVPSGWLAVLDAFDLVGRHAFPDDWKCTELNAPFPREIQQAREALAAGEPATSLGPLFTDPSDAETALRRAVDTWHQLCQWLNAGTVRAEILSDGGPQIRIREYQWAAKNTAIILHSGKTSVATDYDSISGWVLISKSDLAQVIGKAQEADETPNYFSPYLGFMLRATKQLGLSENTRKTKAEIEDWLRQYWPAELGQSSKSKISYMATFLRHPEDGKGGHFKHVRKT